DGGGPGRRLHEVPPALLGRAGPGARGAAGAGARPLRPRAAPPAGGLHALPRRHREEHAVEGDQLQGHPELPRVSPDLPSQPGPRGVPSLPSAAGAVMSEPKKPAPPKAPLAEGAKPAAAAAVPAEPAGPPPRAEIHARFDKGRPKRFEVAPGGTVLGRDDQVAVPVLRDGVSREHARIEWDGKGWCLSDLKSTHAHLLNGVR